MNTNTNYAIAIVPFNNGITYGNAYDIVSGNPVYSRDFDGYLVGDNHCISNTFICLSAAKLALKKIRNAKWYEIRRDLLCKGVVYQWFPAPYISHNYPIDFSKPYVAGFTLITNKTA